jgi:DNA-binding NarL/FixJ family response regulator
MNKVRVLLADDHKIILEGLRRLLEPEFEVVGAVEDGRSLLRAAERLRPDVIVVDVSMPLLNGIEAVREIKRMEIPVKVVFLTMHPDATYAKRSIQVGALGYVLKHSAPSELVTAIREAMRGRTYVTPALTGDALGLEGQGGTRSAEEPGGLTSRQREVLQLLAEGHSAKQIADIMCISPRTVEFHKYRMMEILNVKSAAALIQHAIRHGIVSI